MQKNKIHILQIEEIQIYYYYIRFIQPNMDYFYIIVSQELHKDSKIALHLSIFIKVKDLLISE